MPDTHISEIAAAVGGGLFQPPVLLFVNSDGVICSSSGQPDGLGGGAACFRRWDSLFEGWEKLDSRTMPNEKQYDLRHNGNGGLVLRVTERDSTGRDGAPNGKFVVIEQIPRGNIPKLEDLAGAAMLGRMTAQFAHELNNALTTIQGYVQMLMQDMPKTDKRYGAFEIVCEETRRTARMAASYLSMARGRPADATPGDVDINDLLNGIILLLEPKFARQQIDLQRRFGSLPAVCGFESELRQVFLNLLLNAMHAVGEGGRITVETAASEDGVKISIADNGCGIPHEAIERIFDAFYTTRAKSGGTGLGLYVSREIVRRHHGTLQVQSTRGKGSTFTIALPLKSPA